MAKTSDAQEDPVNIALSILTSIFHIIESLLSQEELPDFYEENLPKISFLMIFVLDNDFNKLKTPSSQLPKCRAKVIKLVRCYSFKFGEHFSQYIQPFFEKIWTIIINKRLPATKQNEKLI